MKLSDKATDIIGILDRLYPEVPIPLDHKNPYTLLIAVLLSAQCTDKRVNLVTPALFKIADNPYEMALQNVEDIKLIIRPCGLSNNKSKAIVNLSKLIVEHHQGKVPKTLVELEKLPGVGHKTASVVVSQAFGIPAFPVDTHIHRLAYRWKLSTGKNVTKTEVDLKRIFSRHLWNKLHLQIIFYGREHCPARGHDPHCCEICSKYGRANMFK